MENLRSLNFRTSLGFKIVYIIIVTGTLYYLFSGYGYDDPFITYRFAQNLSAGIGFVYNQGEHILSTTTPLFAIILAFFGKLWLDIPLLAKLIGALSIATGGVSFWELGKTWRTPMVGWGGLLLYPTFPLFLITMGSETPLFLAFILGGFVMYAKHHYGWSAFLITLAILTRSDGVLAGIILGGHYIWKNRNKIQDHNFWREQPWLWIGGCLGLLLAWFIFATIYFGSPLPVTLATKQAQGQMAISQLFAPGLFRVAGWFTGSFYFWVEFGLLIIGIVYSGFRKQRWFLIWAWTGLYFLAYHLLGVPGYFWYYAPLVPGWVVGIGLGLAFFMDERLLDRFSKSTLWSRISLVLVGLLFTSLFVSQVYRAQNVGQRLDHRYLIYQAVGKWFAENTSADAYVGALEVGIIGYFGQRRMLDFAGLIQPDVADQMQQDTNYDDTALWALDKYEPDYIGYIKEDQSTEDKQPFNSFMFTGNIYD